MPRWLVAGTDVGDRYPCLCRKRGCDPVYCPCAGRPDVDDMPAMCCSHRYTVEQVAAARRADSARRTAARRTDG